MPGIIVILIGVLLLSLVTFSGDSTPATEGASSSFTGCSELERGQSDPVGGKYCVSEVQAALRNLGYNQPVTGIFGPTTQENVKKFQRRQNIKPNNGRVGPQTRKALFGDGPSPSVDEVPSGSYLVSDYCTSKHKKCSVDLSRTTTRKYADQLAAHPVSATVMSSVILGGACGKLIRVFLVSLVCQIFAEQYATDIKNTLATAKRQNACLRITLKLRPDTGKPLLVIDTDNNPKRCRD